MLDLIDQIPCESSRIFCCASPMNGSCKECCDVRAGEWGILVVWSLSGLELGLGVPDRPNHNQG